MKKYLYLSLFVLFVLFVIFYFVIANNIGVNNKVFIFGIKSKISQETKNKIKKIFFPYKNQKLLNKKLDELNLIISSQNLIISSQKDKIEKKNRIIESFISDHGIKFIKNESINVINIEDQKYILEKFTTDFLSYGKNYQSKGTSYIDYVDNYLVLSSATGKFGYIDFKEFSKNTFVMQSIPTNINEIIKDKQFYKTSYVGIKDILIYDSKIYVAYSNRIKENCYNTSIIFANLNFKKLIFEKFFTPDICQTLKFGMATQSGGRMIPFQNKKILFSHGNYGYNEHAQNKKNIFGKIISIDLTSRKYEIISMGHRNVQGLYYDNENNFIISTEHGPTGGDEINIINLFNKITPNYGWPISSYGKIYSKDEVKFKNKKNPFKSHKEHGFTEPIKYFTPAIGISQIVKVELPVAKNNYNHYFVASMGWAGEEEDQSIYHVLINPNEERKLFKYESFFVNERIRDMIFVKNLKKVFFFLETTASIGVLALN